MAWNLLEKPLLVFWETTLACDLACLHCRASAMREPLPGTLQTDEARALIDQIADFGRPAPILVMTGGDALKRPDLFELIAHARERGIRVAVSPSATPLLTEEVVGKLSAAGVQAMSLSLDGAEASSHDSLRGVPGTWTRTVALARAITNAGMRLQINSTVMAHNVFELPELFGLVRDVGADIWEVFFLVQTGRGRGIDEASPRMCEAVCHFLYHAAHYGVTVRTVEGPFFRRVVQQYQEGREARPDYTAERLIRDLERSVGLPTHQPRTPSVYTRDGKGVVFVSCRGDVTPSGFLPLTVGNVRRTPLPEIYRQSPLLRSLRDRSALHGLCGRCPYSDICAGSRARAYAHCGDVLADDPACIQVAEPHLSHGTTA